MITLSNGHRFRYVVASGALGFSGLGWWWERPLVWLGLIKPELFTVVLKTITRDPRKGNLCWWKPWTWLPFSPWSCVRFIKGGAVNKVGLTNGGLHWFIKKIVPKLNFKKYKLVASLYGTMVELIAMVQALDKFGFVAYELNVSCPNTGHGMSMADEVAATVRTVKRYTNRPLIVKVSADQDYIAITEGVKGYAEAMSLNSVPWLTVFPHGQITPLAKLEKKVGGGGGGVSGTPAQELNWRAVYLLVKQAALPVIGPGIMNYDDLVNLRIMGAHAFSFGAIHLRTPWKATEIVKKDRFEQKYKSLEQVGIRPLNRG